MGLLNLARLRTFCEVADASSYTVAASRLFRTQPAVSKQVAELEAELGLRLFERHGRAIRLTPPGVTLYERARRLLEEAAEFEAKASALARGEQGALRLGAHTLLFRQTLPRLLTAFAKAWPTVDVSVVEDNAERLAMRVESRELDFAFARYMSSDTLTARRLFPMYVVVVVGLTHRFAKRASVEVNELADEALLLMPRDSGSRILLDQTCRAEGIRLRRPKMETNSPEGLVNMAAAGHGVALLLTMASVNADNVRAVPLLHHGKHLATWSSILWARRRDLPPYAKALIELASIQLKTEFPGEQFGFPSSAEGHVQSASDAHS